MTTPAIPDEMPQIECHCGFIISGRDEQINRQVFEDHSCGDIWSADDSAPSWHNSVFSLWGVLIAVIIATAVVQVMTGKSWW
jgi:hypothetical protein